MSEKEKQQKKSHQSASSFVNKKKEDRSKKPHSQFQPKVDDFQERVIKIRRVVKVTKGGRRFRFSATAVVGNNKGKVGFATKKANEVPDGIKKAIKSAKSPKSLTTIPIIKETIPHSVIGHYGSSRVLLKPAKAGTGIIAGGPVRTLIEISGIHNIYSKVLKGKASVNVIRATINAFQQLRTANEIKKLRMSNEETTSNKKIVKEQ